MDQNTSDYHRIAKLIAGVDEVGRGPLAGPVVTAAVILDEQNPIAGLTDSKKLSEHQREKFAEEIKAKAIAWSLGRAEVHEIDEINILQATLLAMQRAVAGLNPIPDYVPVISAASIIAKVARDQEMQQLDLQYPGYGLHSHKGYPTKKHIAALEQLGITPIHRRSYGPVKKLL